MSDSQVLAEISRIAIALQDATEGDEWHAISLIVELADGRLAPAVARAEFAELRLRHA